MLRTQRHHPSKAALYVIVWLTLGLAAGVLAGCGNREPDSAALSVADACEIALTPHSAGADADRTIELLIETIHNAGVRRGVHLERLGWAYVALARQQYDAGYHVLAEQTALCLESQPQQRNPALLLRAHALYSQHRFGEAEPLARELASDRGLPVDYAVYGDVLMARGALDEAIAVYQRMMDLKPGPYAYSRAAHVRWLKGDLPGAIALMKLSAGASGSHDPNAAAWAHERLAAYELQAGRADLAVSLLSTALDLLPDYAPALLARGQLLLAAGDAADAVAVLEQAANLNPLPAYQWALIEALRAANRHDRALAVHQRLMSRGAVDDRRTFALYLASTGQAVDEALVLARRELASRRDVFTLDTYAWALCAAGRVDEAQVASLHALREGTQDARLHYHAGVIARQAGDIEAAAGWLASAVAMQQSLLPSERAHLKREFAALRDAEMHLPAVPPASDVVFHSVDPHEI